MNKSLRAQAHDLVNTSIQDMQSGLWAYGVADLRMLKIAQEIAEKRGEPTKAKVLGSKIRKLEKLALTMPAFRDTPMDGAL